MNCGAILTLADFFSSYHQENIIKKMGNVRVLHVPILHDVRYCPEMLGWWLCESAFSMVFQGLLSSWSSTPAGTETLPMMRNVQRLLCFGSEI
ncbi:unnamed protein product, partial [Bubo scandiacus]